MSALTEMTTRLSELYGVKCDFQCDQMVLLAGNHTATQFYRIAQEATTNAIRHAHPTQINIYLNCSDNAVVLRVLDDGRGFSANDSTPGMGLRTMQYRASLINAELIVTPLASRGTEVVCKMPL